MKLHTLLHSIVVTANEGDGKQNDGIARRARNLQLKVLFFDLLFVKDSIDLKPNLNHIRSRWILFVCVA